MIYVRFKKLTKTAQIPTKGTAGAAGYDLYVDTETETTIHPGETVDFNTGIAVEIPAGYVGLVFSRSGIATKRNLRLPHCVGVIDSDYRGAVHVPLHNDCNPVQVVKPHERVAQIVVMPAPEMQLYEVDALTVTERGKNGFGSTGR